MNDRTNTTTEDTTKLAVACFDYGKNIAEWDHREDLAGKHGVYFGAGFTEYDWTSRYIITGERLWAERYAAAYRYIDKMNSCEYTAGFHWKIIPFTDEALAEFARSCQRQ